MYTIGIINNKLVECKVADLCPNCKIMSEMNYEINLEYFIFGLPFFPTSKYAAFKCFSCNTTMHINVAPKFVLQKHDLFFTKTKTPLYTYSMLILMGIVITIGIIKFIIEELGKLF